MEDQRTRNTRGGSRYRYEEVVEEFKRAISIDEAYAGTGNKGPPRFSAGADSHRDR